MARAARLSGFELLVYSAYTMPVEGSGWERRYLSRLGGTMLSGALLLTSSITDFDYPLPLVAIDPYLPIGVPSVTSDNLGGAKQAVEHLIRLGHRRIGMLTGTPGRPSSDLREAGYRRALEEAGLPVPADLIQVSNYNAELVVAPARRLLSRPERPSAVFAANDLSAIAALQVAVELGIKVPHELSIVGFDNIPESALTSPPLTTVNQPIRLIGERAVELLVQLIRGEAPSGDIVLPTDLVIRESTGPA